MFKLLLFASIWSRNRYRQREEFRSRGGKESKFIKAMCGCFFIKFQASRRGLYRWAPIYLLASLGKRKQKQRSQETAPEGERQSIENQIVSAWRGEGKLIIPAAPTASSWPNRVGQLKLMIGRLTVRVNGWEAVDGVERAALSSKTIVCLLRNLFHGFFWTFSQMSFE